MKTKIFSRSKPPVPRRGLSSLVIVAALSIPLLIWFFAAKSSQYSVQMRVRRSELARETTHRARSYHNEVLRFLELRVNLPPSEEEEEDETLYEQVRSLELGEILEIDYQPKIAKYFHTKLGTGSTAKVRLWFRDAESNEVPKVREKECFALEQARTHFIEKWKDAAT